MYVIDKKKKIFRLVCLVIVSTIILTFLEFIILYDYKRELKVYNNDYIARYTEEYNTIIADYRMVARTYFDEVINKSDIIQIVKEANTASTSRSKKLRNILRKKLSPTYKRMDENNFRQFQFALKDGRSFLRMHKVDRYGDDLESVRATVEIANREHRYVEGFEEGRVYNGYRFEFPLFDGEEYIGCVETSISFMSIIKMVDKLFKDPTTFMIKKSVVDAKVWQEQKVQNYRDSKLADDYYYDREALDYIRSYGNYDETIDSVVKSDRFLKDIGEKLDDGDSFIVNTEIGDIYSITFLSINNVLGEHVGYLVFYSKNYIYNNLKKSFFIKSILVLVVWIMLLVIIIVFYLSNLKISRVSYTDKLTGAYNRNRFYEYLQFMISHTQRSNEHLSIIIYDMDNFKKINDNYGHSIGDMALKAVTKIATNVFRKSDKIFRFGGDEFIVILPQTSLKEAVSAAERLRLEVEKSRGFGIMSDDITLSIGVAQLDDGEDFKSFINRVDRRLYRAKNEGRNLVIAKS